MIFAARIQQTILISLLISGIFAVLINPPATAQADGVPLLIYQVQTGAASSASREYISVYNNSDQPVEVTGWCVNYGSASDISQSQLACINAPNASTQLYLQPRKAFFLATSEFVQAHPGFIADFAFTSGISSASGHIKLLDPGKNIADLVGWGAAAKPEGNPVPAPAAGKILQRQSIGENILKDSGNNAVDFYQTDLALQPGENIYEEFLEAGKLPILTEIFPNAAGADDGKEFIEFYNPADIPVNLEGYSLLPGPGFSKPYALPGITVQPKSYIALSDLQTGITLPNTGSAIRLLDPGGSAAGEVSYSDLEEDMSLAYAGGSWQKTFQPTPGAENIILDSKPCPANQARDPETGQCKIAKPISAITPCKPGQIRNTETGRCRNAANPITAQVSCKAGQQKNPATGRCRNTASTSVPKPCPASQQRNVQTGRCKKITALAASGTNSVKDVPSALVSNNMKWWIIGAAGLGSLGYAGFEWRREVFGFLVSIRNKIIPS